MAKNSIWLIQKNCYEMEDYGCTVLHHVESDTLAGWFSTKEAAQKVCDESNADQRNAYDRVVKRIALNNSGIEERNAKKIAAWKAKVDILLSCENEAPPSIPPPPWLDRVQPTPTFEEWRDTYYEVVEVEHG